MVSRIRALCESIHITLNRLEKEAGLSKSTIARWDENLPSIDKVRRVADYLHVSTDYLLGRTDDPTPPEPPAAAQGMEPEREAADPEGIEVLAASSGIPVNQLSEAQKKELRRFINYLLSQPDGE